MLDIAGKVVERAQAHGAQDAAASAYQVREVSVQWRDGAVEKLTEATTRGVGVELYVDGRYASVSTSDLRPDALDAFIADAVAMTRALTPDPFRGLPDPHFYLGQSNADLELADPHYGDLTAVQRRELAQQLEIAARQTQDAQRILSVTTSVSDSQSHAWRVHSDGFSGEKSGTSYWLGAEVSVQDPDGRRPEDACYAGARWRGDVPDPQGIGEEAARRTLSRLGTTKPGSGQMTLVVDARAAGRVVSSLLGGLSAAGWQQKRSFLEGKIGHKIGNALLDLTDDPLVVRGLGSRRFDGEGMASRPLPLFEDGVLQNGLVDTYYGKKLQMPPTTGRLSNLRWRLGDKSREDLIRDVGNGILVTGFLGGNANGTTGDFSWGIQGFAIRDGEIAEPIGEANISGNHMTLWPSLAAIGNDPYRYSALRTPSLVFTGVNVAGR
jgi:PmbA protein